MASRKAELKAELERKKAMLEAIKQRLHQERKHKGYEDSNKIISRGSGDWKELNVLLQEVGVEPISASTDYNIEQKTDPPAQTQDKPCPVVLQQKRVPQLTVSSVQSTNIPPHESIVFSKQTQTSDGYNENNAHTSNYYVLTYEEDEENYLPSNLDKLMPSKISSKILDKVLPHLQEELPVEEHEEEQKEIIKDFSEEEKQTIILSDEFQQFLDKTGRIMERVLCENIRFDMDYIEAELDELPHQRIALNRNFSDERWTRNRTVTSLDWSPQFSELLLAAYNHNDKSTNDPDGVVLVWNKRFRKSTPEFIFHCQSAVLSATFARFHPNLIIGGTYSGQIVLWDNRSHKRTPVQRTPPSATTHTQPVYCMKVVGTPNSHNLITISTDGRLCSWSLDMLNQPQDILQLHRMNMPTKPVAATCFDFPHLDANNFIVGSEEGSVYSACRHGTRAGIMDIYDDHQGPVTGISINDVQGGADLSHLFLTTSVDWTIKLWSLKETRPLYSFETNGDYVLDVKWSPVHPALFATVDGSGRLDVWNLNYDTDVPTVSINIEGNPALNKVSWTPDGLQIAVGDTQGRIWMYDVTETFAHPRFDEWNKLLYTIQQSSFNNFEGDMETLNVSEPNSSVWESYY